MDFDESDEERAFRAEARGWLEANARRREIGDDPDHFYLSGDESPEADAAHVASCKAWQRTLFDGGWAGITWPREWGGRGGKGWQQRIFNEEMSRFDVSAGVFAVGIGMAGPTIIAHGTPAQQERYLPAMLRGDEIWCQLFSEPGAGSDLAGLRTRAVLDGDEWIVNGQKVWTSGAHHSDFGLMLARTDLDAPKHRGISAFIVDMRAPGIEVRPLRQINGMAHFNEVFFTDARVPTDHLLGDANAGWGVAQTMLANERALIGGGGRVGFKDMLALAQRCGVTADARVRQDLAQCFTRTQILKWLGWRARSRASGGLGPESSVMKLAYSQRVERDGDLALALQGAAGMLSGDDAHQHGYWQQQFLMQWSSRIGGGTDQVQRNVIGDRVLGLPPDVRVDKGVPFRDLPHS
ncbi:MAG TPA: acyl-CoA dehydrogenase family protein [Acidimicrobiia bacterium]|nr:acyl-CoA dehydrogenase family protein [Acidimicrobiia bacterium]